MDRIDANKLTKAQLVEILVNKKSKTPSTRAAITRTYLAHRKGYLVALVVEAMTRKNSKEYPAAKAALTLAAQKESGIVARGRREGR